MKRLALLALMMGMTVNAMACDSYEDCMSNTEKDPNGWTVDHYPKRNELSVLEAIAYKLDEISKQNRELLEKTEFIRRRS